MNQIRIPEWIFPFILTTFLLDIVLNGYCIDIDTVLMEVKGFKKIYIYLCTGSSAGKKAANTAVVQQFNWDEEARRGVRCNARSSEVNFVHLLHFC